MHGALQHIRARASEGQGADDKRQEQQHQRRHIEAEFQKLSGQKADSQDGRQGQTDRRERGAKEQIHRALELVVARCGHRRHALRGQHKDRDDNPAERHRRADLNDAEIDQFCDAFR